MEGKRAYTSVGDQSREASGHIPRSGTNHGRRAGIYLRLKHLLLERGDGLVPQLQQLLRALRLCRRVTNT
eukprot:1036863-Pyramimonas_sp.AAC.1